MNPYQKWSTELSYIYNFYLKYVHWMTIFPAISCHLMQKANPLWIVALVNDASHGNWMVNEFLMLVTKEYFNKTRKRKLLCFIWTRQKSQILDFLAKEFEPIAVRRNTRFEVPPSRVYKNLCGQSPKKLTRWIRVDSESLIGTRT